MQQVVGIAAFAAAAAEGGSVTAVAAGAADGLSGSAVGAKKICENVEDGAYGVVLDVDCDAAVAASSACARQGIEASTAIATVAALDASWHNESGEPQGEGIAQIEAEDLTAVAAVATATAAATRAE
ncbi:hypothetical protein BST23_21010 [Mycolicibacterium elephantis]|uniref:Uncharacterized protein n=1 Tax=Mycolicibacterium elephantis TaxID=81858 RepID=A0A1A0QSH9_9MYCO|nr:hypothetical protein A5762_10235 [Mycolicibacterium elephantis]OBE98748.1 hypothetical protein A5776_13835 [Mycolicibacterium elephantis]ORA61855.1 hypothetical protein BST23_21010 [Mycolicibacterium elephantis]